MNILFLMDPLETVSREKDTSLILMVGAKNKGHNVFYLPKDGIVLKDGKCVFYTQKVTPDIDSEELFKDKKNVVLGEDDIDAIFVRTDPPFDQKYLMHTWLLDRLEEKITIINSPKGIRTANEKIWATHFTEIMPTTIVSCRKDALLDFISSEKKVVAKPTDGYGGQSIFIVEDGDLNANVILEILTDKWKKEIILQGFVPESDKGDKRILLLDGEPLGAVLRVHKKGDHRNNIFSGGNTLKSEITSRDKEIISILKPELKKIGLYFVGIDIIGDYLIEVNVTSPTCLQEMIGFSDERLEEKVIEFLEGLDNNK